MLFSDPTGSGIEGAPQVLVQGTADVDDRDLDANRERYKREQIEKLPATQGEMPPKVFERLIRLVPHAHLHPRAPGAHLRLGRRRPVARAASCSTRTWRRCAPGTTRSRTPSTPDTSGGTVAWDERMEELGARYPEAVGDAGLPRRLPVLGTRAGRGRLAPRSACAWAAPPSASRGSRGWRAWPRTTTRPTSTWQRNFQVRGDLVEEDGAWAVIPRKLIGGFELPPGSLVARTRQNLRKFRRFRKIAKRELAARGR